MENVTICWEIRIQSVMHLRLLKAPKWRFNRTKISLKLSRKVIKRVANKFIGVR